MADADPQGALDVLSAEGTKLLREGSLLKARKLVLEAWRKQRHTLLADLIDAIDLRIRRSPEVLRATTVEALFGSMQQELYAFSHDWRQWFTRDPDTVANRLAIFEAHPDPAAAQIVLELLLVAPPQLLIAERLWSVVERVLIALSDVRALISVSAFLDGRWPPRRTHLAIQSVPHLESAVKQLEGRPAEPSLLAPLLENALRSELEVVRACSKVSPVDLLEDNAQLRQFADAQTPAARLLLGDWLAERGDPRGLLINVDREVGATAEVECLRVKAAQRWLSTASQRTLADVALHSRRHRRSMGRFLHFSFATARLIAGAPKRSLASRLRSC